MCYSAKVNGRIAMSITSTRRVSTSLAYSQRAGGYDAGSGGQSFVENIDTSKNVSVNNEENAVNLRGNLS